MNNANTLRITGLKTTLLSVPFSQPTSWPYGRWDGLTVVLVEVETNCGVTGLGESVCLQDPASSVEQYIHGCAPLLVGEDPFDCERLEKKMLGYGGWLFAPQSFGYVLGGIDMALWDIRGKACGLPLYKLLGGAVRKEISFMKFLHHDSPECMADEAEVAVAEGYEILYFKYTTIAELKDAIRSVRERVGSAPGVWVDFNQTLSPGFAVRLMPFLEEMGVCIVEQPTLASDLEGLKYVTTSTSIQVLAHESSWSVSDVFRVAASRAADIVSVEPRMQGSMLAAKKAAAICESVGMPVLMHAIGELGVAHAAYLHFLASTPNAILANQTMYDWLAGDIIAGGMMPLRGGRQLVPEGPGLGIELDRSRVAEYAENYRRAGKYSYFGGSYAAQGTNLPVPLRPSY
jgi:L-alanine-DL-glutamate epimerase-like enolase superfamily enzyme